MYTNIKNETMTTTSTTTTTTTDNTNNKTIIFVCASPGTGKTFTGDYLEVVHGFHHVDGDMMNDRQNPKVKKVGAEIWECLTKYDGEDGPYELWQPYMHEIAIRTLEAAKKSDKVVLTFAAMRNTWRNYIMSVLKEQTSAAATAAGDMTTNISMVFLTMDQDVKLEGLYHRTKRQAEGRGGIRSFMRFLGWEGEGEITLQEFKTFTNTPGKFGSWICEDPPSYVKVIDVTNRDVTTIDGVDAAIGLQRSGEDSYEQILQKVLAIDHKRDENADFSEEDLKELEQFLNENINKSTETGKDKVDRETIERRRSSLIKND